MCQSSAEGGKRCAAHTRPGYQAVTGDLAQVTASDTPSPALDTALSQRVRTGYGVLVAYASTRSGLADVQQDYDRLAAHYANQPAQSMRHEAARQESLAAYRTALTVAQSRLGAETDVRAAAAAVRPQNPKSRKARQERQTLAEDVIWCVNHGYIADARAGGRRFEKQFGEPSTDLERPKVALLIGKRARAEEEERRAHAEEVVYLISNGWTADAKYEARRFADRFGGGVDPTMAADMMASRTGR